MAKKSINKNGSSPKDIIDSKGRAILKMNNKGTDLNRIGTVTEELNPSKLASVFREAATPGDLGRLMEVYYKIEKYDTKIQGLVEKRRKAPTRFETDVKIHKDFKDNSDAQDAAEMIEKMIDDMDFKDLKRKTINGILWGVYIMMNKWKRNGDYITFSDPEEVSTSRYAQNNSFFRDKDSDNGKLYIKQSTASQEDRVYIDEIADSSLFTSIYNARRYYYDLAGIMRPVCKWYLFKYFTFQYWMEYNETYGFPTSVATIPREDYYTFKDEIESLMQNVGRNKYGIIFDGMEFKIHAQQSNGQVEFFKELTNQVNNEINFGILGTNLQEGGQKSTYASSVVGYDMETDLIIDDSEFVDKTINDNLIKPFIRANYANLPSHAVGVTTNTPERKDWKKIEKKWEIAAKLGLKGVSKSQIEDELEVKFATDKEDSIDLSWGVKPNTGGEHKDPEKRNEEREDGGSVAEE